RRSGRLADRDRPGRIHDQAGAAEGRGGGGILLPARRPLARHRSSPVRASLGMAAGQVSLSEWALTSFQPSTWVATEHARAAAWDPEPAGQFSSTRLSLLAPGLGGRGPDPGMLVTTTSQFAVSIVSPLWAYTLRMVL